MAARDLLRPIVTFISNTMIPQFHISIRFKATQADEYESDSDSEFMENEGGETYEGPPQN